jgi:large subunit ribosomal protein LX
MTAKETSDEKKSVNVFKVTGSFRKGKDVQVFTKEIIVNNKQEAEEHVLSILGSQHRAKRSEIDIEKIEKIPIDEVKNPIIKQMIGGK